MPPDDNLAEDQATNEDDLDDADGLSDDINDELTLDFKADEESEKKDKEEKDKSKDDDIVKEVDTLKSELEQLKEDKKNLNKALHSLRQEKKKDSVKADTGRLSEAQLKQIIEDNPNDTDTQFRVLQYLAEEYSKGASKEAVNAAEISRTKTKLDDYLNEQYPEINEDGSDMRREVEEAKKGLALENHPFGDYLAVAARVLDAVPNLMKDAFEKGKAQGLGQKADAARKEDIAAGKSPKDKKGSGKQRGLTSSQSEVADQMDLTPSQRKNYERIMGRSKKAPRTISVEE